MAVPSKILNSLRLISCTILKPVLMFGEKIWGMAINIYHLEPNNRRHYFYAVDGFKCFTWSCRFSNVQVLWFCMQENDPLCKRICYRVFFSLFEVPFACLFWPDVYCTYFAMHIFITAYTIKVLYTHWPAVLILSSASWVCLQCQWCVPTLIFIWWLISSCCMKCLHMYVQLIPCAS